MATINPAKSLKETTFCTTLAWLLHFSCSNASLFLSSYIIGRFFRLLCYLFFLPDHLDGSVSLPERGIHIQHDILEKDFSFFFFNQKTKQVASLCSIIHYICVFCFLLNRLVDVFMRWLTCANAKSVSSWLSKLSLCWIGYIFIETRPGWTTPKQTDAFDQ